MGMLDWASSAWDYVSDAVSETAGTVVDWVSDWFEDDSADIGSSSGEYEYDSADFSLDGDFGDYKSSLDSFNTIESSSGYNLLGDTAANLLSDPTILSEGKDFLGTIDADTISSVTDKSEQFGKGTSLEDKGSSKKEDDKEKDWWDSTVDFAKSEGGSKLISGLLTGGAAMYTASDDLEDAKSLAKYKSDLENSEYSYQYGVSHPASESSSSTTSSDDEDTTSATDRITTLAQTYPAKTDFKRS